MFNLKIEATEAFDEATNSFINIKEQVYKLEHSLISISKWEAKWHKPFLGDQPKSLEEDLDYIRCMAVGQEPDKQTLKCLKSSQIKDIFDYIQDSMTATWFNERNKKPSSRRVITSELIYYWMASSQIPFSCEKWHLNRLLTLIRICNIENSPKKKMNKREQMAEQRALNAARRQKYNSRG